MAKRKKIALENIPAIVEKVVAVIDREVDSLSAKATLTDAESKNLIAYTQLLCGVYKDYRAEVIEIKKELKGKTKEEIQEMIKAEVN